MDKERRPCVLHSCPDGILVELKEANERLWTAGMTFSLVRDASDGINFGQRMQIT